MDAKQLTQELALKAINAVHTLVSDFNRGLITQGQVSAGCQAVFNTVSGLVDTETVQLLSDAAKEYRCTGYDVEAVRTAQGIQGTIRVCGKGRVMRFIAQPLFQAGAGVDEPDAEAKDAVMRYIPTLGS